MRASQETLFNSLQLRRHAVLPRAEVDLATVTSFALISNVYRMLDTIFPLEEKRGLEASGYKAQFPKKLVAAVIDAHQSDQYIDNEATVYEDRMIALEKEFHVSQEDLVDIFSEHVRETSAHQVQIVKREIQRGIVAIFGLQAQWQVEIPITTQQSLLVLLLQRSVLPQNLMAEVVLSQPEFIPGMLQEITTYHDEVDSCIPEEKRKQDPKADSSFPILFNDFTNIIDGRSDRARRYRALEARHQAARNVVFTLCSKNALPYARTMTEREICQSILEGMLDGSAFTITDSDDPLRKMHAEGIDTENASVETNIPLSFMEVIWRGLDYLKE